MQQQNKLCLIIPCFNEAGRLALNDFAEFLNLRDSSQYRIIFVNDGSSDHTSAILAEFTAAFENAELVDLSRNSGKAEAVRQGMLHALTQYPDSTHLGFWDADLATPLSEVDNFMQIAVKDPAKTIIIGNRHLKDNENIKRNIFRDLISRSILILINMFLNFPLKDSQCGAKIFSRHVATVVFKKHFVSRWLFDVEIFKRFIEFTSKRQLATNLHEYDLYSWQEVAGSKLKFYHIGNIFCEMVKINLSYKNSAVNRDKRNYTAWYRLLRKKLSAVFLSEIHFKVFQFTLLFVLFLFIIHDIYE